MTQKITHAEALAVLGEVLNIAAEVAELQQSEESRSEIYSLLDVVAEYYGVERTEYTVEGDIVENDATLVRFTNDPEEYESVLKDRRDRILHLAVDNDDPKKIH